MSGMKNTSDTVRKGYTQQELDCATDFVSGLIYPLWIKSRKNEIMEEDKTFYSNEELNNTN